MLWIFILYVAMSLLLVHMLGGTCRLRERVQQCKSIPMLLLLFAVRAAVFPHVPQSILLCICATTVCKKWHALLLCCTGMLISACTTCLLCLLILQPSSTATYELTLWQSCCVYFVPAPTDIKICGMVLGNTPMVNILGGAIPFIVLKSSIIVFGWHGIRRTGAWLGNNVRR